MSPRPVLVAAALGLAACGMPDNGPQMLPGSNCMSCHAVDGSGASSHGWTVAGTVFDDPQKPTATTVQEAEVIVTDALGKALTIRTNGGGNFYTAEPLKYPIHVEVQYGDKRMAMSSAPPVGSCNACHTGQGLNGAPGKLFVPTN